MKEAAMFSMISEYVAYTANFFFYGSNQCLQTVVDGFYSKTYGIQTYDIPMMMHETRNG
jgi:hypothetical protein